MPRHRVEVCHAPKMGGKSRLPNVRTFSSVLRQRGV